MRNDELQLPAAVVDVSVVEEARGLSRAVKKEIDKDPHIF
jgi:hypothetical protein